MRKKNWTMAEIKSLYDLPFMELLFQAHSIHKKYFTPNEMQLCSLLSIKTGTCPEDCAYCPQSGHYQTNVEREKILSVEEVIAAAKRAKENGAVRFCMGAAWRNPPVKDFPQVLAMIKAVKALGLETCATLGMLDENQAKALKQAGLDFYNHNLDTSPDYYQKIITTRIYGDRLKTLEEINKAGLHTCCGGIIGMGESVEDRLELLKQLAILDPPPKSVPINRLIPINGTPLENSPVIDNIEFIRIIAVARIMLPTSMLRLSAGRETMSEEMQILCFFAGSNSIFFGEKLLTAKNPACNQDLSMFKKLGIHIKQANHAAISN